MKISRLVAKQADIPTDFPGIILLVLKQLRQLKDSHTHALVKRLMPISFPLYISISSCAQVQISSSKGSDRLNTLAGPAFSNSSSHI